MVSLLILLTTATVLKRLRSTIQIDEFLILVYEHMPSMPLFLGYAVGSTPHAAPVLLTLLRIDV